MAPTEPQAFGLDCFEFGGYRKLADHLGCHPEQSILRRFGALGIENLLYYQAQIAELEADLRKLQLENEKSQNSNQRLCGIDWSSLRDAEVGGPERAQYDLVMELRALIREYHEALYYHAHALSLRRPHHRILEDLRVWMGRPALGRINIISCDHRTWESKALEYDLLTFENSMMDGFTSWITYRVIDVYHNFLGRYIHGSRKLPVTNPDDQDMITYSHTAIAKFTRTITVFLASMLPIGAIVLLYLLQDMAIRLGLIAGLTGLFSVSMNSFTMASLPEIFTATSTFAAVLVVFVSATNNSASV